MLIKKTKTINLALQGGGSHGAFTWGVLNRLLEENSRLQIEGISGTSAGALNAAMMLQGYEQGGASGAIKMLDQFWYRLGGLSVFGVSQRSFFDQMMGNWNTDSSIGAMMLDSMGMMFSPHQVNPLRLNPFRDLLNELFDIDVVRNCALFKLFVSATNVETGRVRVFSRDEITADVLMASACLPFAFHAVMIDGEPYWDGGYSGNPAIFPLIYHCQSQDVAIVQLIPMSRPGTPDSPTEIINRFDEISFNSSLISEIRAIDFVRKLIDEDHLKSENSKHYKRMNMHVIKDEPQMLEFGSNSRANTDLDFLLHLKKLGYAAADRWLEENWDSIGERSSVDLKEMFL
ncbi:MAG: patatin-like phospholipase family protein [Alphaproteobacteria bacterium]|nr:patatin-like phospholipase family protein [Alphaproteobacteria bacterium]